MSVTPIRLEDNLSSSALRALESIREVVAEIDRRCDPAEIQAVDQALGDVMLEQEIIRKNNARYAAYLTAKAVRL